MNCPKCQKSLTHKNTPNGDSVSLYEILMPSLDNPKPVKEQGCKECYLELYKAKYPKAEAPQI